MIFSLGLSFLFNIINIMIIWKLGSFLRNLLIRIFFFRFIVLTTLKISIEHLCLIIVLSHLLSKLAESLMSKRVDIEKLLGLLFTLLLLIFFKLRGLRWSNCLKLYSVKDTALELGLVLRFKLNIIIEFI